MITSEIRFNFTYPPCIIDIITPYIEGDTMKKILIIGCPGSGKSSLAVWLSKELSLPLVHLDKINWLNNQEYLSRDKFNNQLTNELMKKEWLIDGNYNRTLEKRITHADTVIWLDLPKQVCLFRIIKRYITNHHKVNSHGNPDTISWSFIKFVWQFNKKTSPQIKNLETMYKKHTNFITLHSTKEVSYFKKNLTPFS